jgi:hypothetical protein
MPPARSVIALAEDDVCGEELAAEAEMVMRRATGHFLNHLVQVPNGS